VARTVTLDAMKGKAFVLHPVHTDAAAADKRPAASASYTSASGAFTIPPRTALVYVVK
jgi:pullulanase